MTIKKGRTASLVSAQSAGPFRYFPALSPQSMSSLSAEAYIRGAKNATSIGGQSTVHLSSSNH